MVVGNHSLPTNFLDGCTEGALYCYSIWASNVTSGLFWVAALMAFAIIIFIATSRLGSVRAFGFASFVGLIGGVFLAVLQLIPWWVGSTFIIIGIVGLASMVISSGR